MPVARGNAHEAGRLLGSPAASAIVFFSFVCAGCLYILVAKSWHVGQFLVTFVPVAFMVAYGALVVGARALRLRDDQTGDNVYYMGFLFTLASLGVSLFQFSTVGAAEEIVRNFGIAIASTIAGIAGRILFNQMRRDPVEVERTARLELATAAARVRRELDATVVEFAHFRRTAQQAVLDGFAEVTTRVDEVGSKVLRGLEEVAEKSAAPLEAASRQSGATIDEVTRTMVGALEATAQRLASETERLSAGATAIASAIEGVAARLASMQTPDHVIEIKLTPMVQALSEAVDRFGASAQAQSRDAAAAIAGATAAAEASARVAADVGRWAERHDTASRDAVELALQTAAATRDAVAGLAVASRENARRIQDALAEMNGSIQVLNGIASKSEADAEGRAIASKALFIALERSARALEVAAERTTSPASIIDVANVRTAAEVAS